MKRIPILILIIVYLTSCSLQEEKAKQPIEEINNNQVSSTLGLFDESATSQLNIKHKINSNQKFTPRITIHNRNSYEDNYRLLVLLDYKQVDFKYKNKIINYIDIKTKPNEKRELNISIENLEPGLHDLLLICISKPKESLTQKVFVPPGHTYLYKRTSLIVDNKENSSREIKATNVNANKGELIPPILTEKPRNILKGKVVTLLEKGEIPSHLWLNFYAEKEKNYHLLFFMDTKQIEIPKMIYSTKNDGVLNIPIDVSRFGTGNLTIVLVENPYHLMEDSEGHYNLLLVDFVNKVTIK